MLSTIVFDMNLRYSDQLYATASKCMVLQSNIKLIGLFGDRTQSKEKNLKDAVI